MPWHNIGTVGDGQMPEDADWIRACLNMALVYLKHACGEPLSDSALGVIWHDDEAGEHPALGVYSDQGPPWDYIYQCEEAWDRFHDAVTWEDLRPLDVTASGVDFAEDFD